MAVTLDKILRYMHGERVKVVRKDRLRKKAEAEAKLKKSNSKKPSQ